MVKRPMSEVRENELLSPDTFFFLNRCVIALGFPSGLPGGSDGKNLPTMQETRVPSLGWEDPLEKEIATLSSVLTWEIPWTWEILWKSHLRGASWAIVHGVAKSQTRLR